MLLGPVGQAVGVEVQQVALARVGDDGRVAPELGPRRLRRGRRAAVIAFIVALTSSLTRSTTVSTLMRPAMWPTKYTSMPTQTKASAMATVSERCGVNSPSSSVRTLRSTISAYEKVPR